MTVEQLKKSGWIILEVISGSHAYGTNKPGSDTDIRGVYVQPTEYILSNNYIPQIGDEKQDIVFYEIGRFIELASKANPNILDLLVTPEDCIIYKSILWNSYFPNPEKFLTKKIEHTFSSYAYSQIQKAKGLNKKVNWDKNQMVRKTPLDFCYVLLDKEQSILFNIWSKNTLARAAHNIGLASVNNFPDIYSMYYLGSENGGIIGDNSNDVQLRNIPKNAIHLGYMRFDRNAYSTHCKDYREYQDWLEKRNPLRYQDNAKVDNQYDTKNMMHCIRLLLTAKDVLEGKGLIIRRPEKDYLLDIREGKLSYEKILNTSEQLMNEVKELVKTSKLPNEINIKELNNTLLQIRLDNL